MEKARFEFHLSWQLSDACLLYLPCLPMNNFIERSPPAFLRGRGKLVLFQGISKRQGNAKVPLGRESENVPCFIGLIDRGRHRADPQLPRRQLHEGRGLACIEHGLELGGWIGSENGDA